MGKYIIELRGCDDVTEFEMDINYTYDLDVLKKVAKKSQETSTYSCQPKMFIYKRERVPVDV
ncbi:MAG: hypothetical protein J6Q89_08655 [Clostridia bacterium]|nr:hypothetical protein [Clostridia bacterium]